MVSQRDWRSAPVGPGRILQQSRNPTSVFQIISNQSNFMNLPSFQFLKLTEPTLTTISSPKLDLIARTWEHIASRYLSRLETNRILAGRVRSIRLLAVHDGIHSVIDPGNGHIYKVPSEGYTTEAAFAAAVRASHDVLVSIFNDPASVSDLGHLLEESLALVGNEIEKAAGQTSGAESAAAYLQTFAPLLVNHHTALRRALALRPVQSRELAGAGWRRSA
jgi:hypothetical protein